MHTLSRILDGSVKDGCFRMLQQIEKQQLSIAKNNKDRSSLEKIYHTLEIIEVANLIESKTAVSTSTGR